MKLPILLITWNFYWNISAKKVQKDETGRDWWLFFVQSVTTLFNMLVTLLWRKFGSFVVLMRLFLRVEADLTKFAMQNISYNDFRNIMEK